MLKHIFYMLFMWQSECSKHNFWLEAASIIGAGTVVHIGWKTCARCWHSTLAAPNVNIFCNIGLISRFNFDSCFVKDLVTATYYRLSFVKFIVLSCNLCKITLQLMWRQYWKEWLANICRHLWSMKHKSNA